MLRVKDWDKNFENNRSRDLQEMQWVPFPNRHDGDGITELLDHPNGMAHYGAWVLLVQVASKCGKPAPKCGPGETPRGTLRRDNGKPHDARSIARVSGGDLNVFEEAIPRLLAIGWIEVIPEESLIYESQSQNGLGVPQESAGIPQEGAGQLRESAHRMEENGKEKNPPPLSPAGSQPQESAGIPQEGAGQLRESAGIPRVGAGNPQADGGKSVPAVADIEKIFLAYPRKRAKEAANPAVRIPENGRDLIRDFLKAKPGYPLLEAFQLLSLTNSYPPDLAAFLSEPWDIESLRAAAKGKCSKGPQETPSERAAREDREIEEGDLRWLVSQTPKERGRALANMKPNVRAIFEKMLLENGIAWEMPGTLAALSAAGGAHE